MTQAPRPPLVKWLVPIPPDDPYGKETMKIVCRGNSDLGDTLCYFLYAASKEAENEKSLDLSHGFVRIKRMQETIAEYLKVSVKTTLTYIRKLTGWKFITPHGYQHAYDVHFTAIAEAMKNPPEQEKPKPRGKYAPRKEDGKFTNSSNSVQDGADGKDGRDELIEQQREEIVNLLSRMEDLETQMVNLRSEMVNLRSLQSSGLALQAALHDFSEPYILLDDYSKITEIRRCIGSDVTTITQAPSALSELRGKIDSGIVTIKHATDNHLRIVKPPLSEEDESALEATVEREDPYRQPFNVSGTATETPSQQFRIAQTGYTPEPASQAALPVTNGYMNQPLPEGEPDNGLTYRPADADSDLDNHQHVSPDTNSDHPGQPDAIAQRAPAGQVAQGDTDVAVHGAGAHVDAGRDLAGRVGMAAALPAGGAGRPDILVPESRALALDAVASATGRTLERAAQRASTVPLAPSQQTVRGARAAPASAPPASSAPLSSDGAATSAVPPRSLASTGSRASGDEETTRSRSGETYATVETWQDARTRYEATLPPVWETLGVSARKQYGSRYPWYRAALLRAWDEVHPKPVIEPLPEPPLTFEQQQRCRAWYQRFIDYRGYAWETQGQCINERKYIKLLVAKYSDVQAAALHDYLFNRHFKWSKPDFRYKIGAYEVYTEGPSVIQILKAEKNGTGGNNGNGTNGYSKPTQGAPGYANSTSRMAAEREKYASGGGRR